MGFEKGNPGRPKGSRNKTNVALSQAIAAGSPNTPLAVMLEVMTYYHWQWKKLKDGPDRRFAAELTLSAARQAAPYVHPRRVIVEEDTTPTINVIDRREIGRVIAGSNGSNGHGGGNGHGGNGSNGSNGHGGNGHQGGHTNGGSSDAYN
jgi:hypothetical protein